MIKTEEGIFMKKFLVSTFVFVFLLGMASCSSYMDEYYKGKKKIHFYHGIKHPDVFISIVDNSSTDVKFKIVRLGGSGVYLYHVILDEDEERISEGWFPTRIIENEYYFVTMKIKKGYAFEPGERYSLCIGGQNPDQVYYRSNRYLCYVDYEFVFPEND
jgi:hypothetical protein